jgi:flagellin-like hook-associated protein FlgL
MGIVGSSTGISLARITNALQSNMLLESMNANMRRMMELQTQISTGNRINTPSDDPIGANTALELRNTLQKNTQYATNVDNGLNGLGLTETAISGLSDILNQAKTLMLQQVGSTATADTRKNAAISVDGMLQEAINIANRKFGNTYLFGGAQTQTAPFSLSGDAVAYNGDSTEMLANISDGISMPVTMSGAAAFGALSTEIRGNVDLNPIITADSKLSDLNGGKGVNLGSIMVTDGTDRLYIDLSHAESVSDVIDMINSVGAGVVTASINSTADGLQLSATSGNVGVYEVDGGKTARDLGILTNAVQAGTLDGADLNPRLTEQTLLSGLLAGTGLTDPSQNIVITNGTQSATINFASATTVQDMLNIINTSGAGVTARINSAGTGIDVVSNLNGARLSIQDATGGSTAAELGLLLDLGRVKLADLNNGIGVSQVSGDDLSITRSDGAVIKVDIANAATVQDVVDLINKNSANTGGLLTASIDAANNRIVLTDNSGGAGDLKVESINGCYAASDLGIAGTVANGPAPMTLTGGDLSPAGVQTESIFTALIRLRDGLLNNDSNAITRSGAMLDTAKTRILNSLAEVGTREQRLDLTKNRLADEKTNFEALLAGTLQVNMAEAITKYQSEQTIYQAGLATAATLLKTSLLDYL